MKVEYAFAQLEKAGATRHRLEVDASAIGIEAGVWPVEIKINFTEAESRLFHRERGVWMDGDLTAVIYIEKDTGKRVRVNNE